MGIDLALFVIMSLAAFRLWRLIAKDHWPPSEWFRDELEALAHHDNAWPGWGTLQTLFLCPWCLGAWLSAAVVSTSTLFVSVPLPVLQWLAVSALVGLIAEAIDQ